MNKTPAIAIIQIVVLSIIAFFSVLVGGTAALVFALKSIHTIEQLVEIGAAVITVSAYVIASLIFATSLWCVTKRSKQH